MTPLSGVTSDPFRIPTTVVNLCQNIQTYELDPLNLRVLVIATDLRQILSCNRATN